MKKFLVVLAVFVNGLAFGQSKYVDYKSGDNDARFTIGLLKTLFSDSLTKYEFGSIDPSIFKLNVVNENYDSIDNFRNWISNFNALEYSSNQFIFIYVEPNEYSNSESIDVIDRYTLELVRTIVINYSEFNRNKNQYTNVGSVSDFIVK